MKSLVLSVALLFAFHSIPATAQSADAELVQQVVQSAYIDGFANLVDISAMEKGFHPSFEVLRLKDGNIEKTTIAQWIAGAKKRVENAAGAAPEIIYTGKFLQLDVTGSVAVSKLDVYKADKLAYTDYLSLYKFDEGWRIVSKVGYSHY